MKRLFLLSITMLAGLMLSAQVETKNFNVSGFTGIDAGGVFNIELTKSDRPSVVIETEAEIMRHIKVTVSRDILNLELDTDDLPRGLRRDMPKVLVKIGMSELKYLDLSGASKLTCLSSFSTDNFRADMSGASKVVDLKIDSRTFSLDVSGAANMSISGTVSGMAKYDLSGAANLDIKQDAGDLSMEGSGASKIKYNGGVNNRVNISFSGASSITMSGKGANRMDVDFSGASKLNALDFPVKDMKIELTGVSKADVNVSNTLNTDISNMSKLNYKGDPKVTHSTPPSIRKIN